jgi:hypothetical protein
MKKYGIYSLAAVLFLVGLFIGSRINGLSSKNDNRSKKEDFNPFLAAQESTDSCKEACDIYGLQGSLVTILNNKFEYNDLPKDIKYKIYREQVAYFERLRTTLKEFALRANYVLSKNAQLDHIDQLPPITDVYQNLVSSNEILEIYQKNKEKLGDSIMREEALASIQYQLLTKRIAKKFKEDSELLQQKNQLSLFNKAPPLPEGALPREHLFKLGEEKGDIEFIFIGSYFCRECFEYNKYITEFFQKFKERVSFSYFPHSHNLMEPDGIFSRAAYCFKKQDSSLFWQFHYNLTKDRETYLTKFTPETSIDEVYDYVKSKASVVNYDKQKFNKCFSEKNGQTFRHILDMNKRLEHLGLAPAPAIVMNNRKLPLSSPLTLKAVIKELSNKTD